MKIGDSQKGDGSSSPRAVMVERVTAFTGEVPKLSKVNYQEWALEMQVHLEGMEIWDAVETGCADRGKDRRALAVILRGVPPEMKSGLAAKKNVKEAWDAVKKMHAGDDRMKDASIQRLMKQFDNLTFRDGESVGDFAMRINGLITSLRELGEKIEDSRVVKKVLRVVPRRLKQCAVAIEMFGDLKNMSIEELVGRLQVAEDADAEDQEAAGAGHVGQLLLTEEQWEARRRQRSGKEQAYGGGARRGVGENGNGHGGDRDDDDDGGSSTSSGRGRSRYRGKCFDCGVRGHRARDCPKKKKERALLADVDEEAALL
jgi:hypothetical protein